MYIIHVNDRPLTLRSTAETETAVNTSKTHLVAHYIGKPRTLLNYVDMLEKGSPKVLSVEIVYHDLDQLWSDFKMNFKWQPAAGGVVYNRDSQKVLFLFRRGWWDLPKGKIDPGESESEAALREVQEETGVEELDLGKPLRTTYHTFRSRKGKRILKPTYWFNMYTSQQDLVPQTTEDIELAVWRSPKADKATLKPLYGNLKLLLGF